MAQGQIKKAKAPAPKNTNRKQTGARVIKPKKASALKREQFKKKHSAGLILATEQSLAGKAGHLEILRGGKKDKKDKKAEKAEKAGSGQTKK
ncbi:hypothetical protein AC579_5795 [Pseudocercospora musae]|uniref:Uncharacterized protein n=1 Tax=Pseudocercospora musae TaxID=113226 RepID=A0A139IR24_9PEZI|nr:hypothetical protein AC579_5795 [Pseudocercospora musae]